MNKIFSLLAVFLLLTLGTNISAQDEEEDYYEKDLLEVAVFGGGTFPLGSLGDWTAVNDVLDPEELGTKLGFNFGLDVGYFLTSDMVLGFDFTYSQFSIDSDLDMVSSRHHRLISPSLYLKYYFFGESSLVPYLKGHAGIDIPKYTTPVFDSNTGGFNYRELSYDPAFAFGIGAGLFLYTHDYGGLFLEANFHNGLTKDVKSGYQGGEYIFGETASVIEAHAGIKVFFGSE